ncbi:peroxiredoxin family protein [Chloroflexota bacterium]
MNRTLTLILITLAFLLPVSGLVASGCATGSAPSDTSAPTEGTRIGNLAPDFQLQSLAGHTVSLSGQRGQPVLLNFWASWCGPCVSEMPFLQEIYEQWSGRGLVLLGINIGESSDKAEQFMQSHELSFPVLLDIKTEVARKYNISGIPTTYFIDQNGVIQEVIIGAFSSKAKIEQSLSKIIP